MSPEMVAESCGSFFKDSSGTVKLKWMLELAQFKCITIYSEDAFYLKERVWSKELSVLYTYDLPGEAH